MAQGWSSLLGWSRPLLPAAPPSAHPPLRFQDFRVLLRRDPHETPSTSPPIAAGAGGHGHSFSGQGAAYISTHSDRFSAIVAGAAATNLVSDFNQLWKSSGTNQHGYDTYGQGRFATNPYDDFDLFVDQSATPNAANMNTPLLILHGSADGSVEWLQAVEFYNGLRWNGKNVILMSYPGEPHHLTKYENQKDFQIRMRQFFDHYLRERPAPRWMESGRSLLEKERHLEMVRPRRDGGGGI